MIYKMKGKTRTHPVGRMDSGVDLEIARAEAKRVTNLIDAGYDPEQRDREAARFSSKSILFKDAWESYVTGHLSFRKNPKKEADVVKLGAAAFFEGRALQSITRDDAREVLRLKKQSAGKIQNDRLSQSGRQPKDNAGHFAARNLQTRLKAFFNWCIENDHIERNPFEKLGMSWDTPARTRALSLDELCLTMEVLPDHPSPTFRALFTTLVFTGMRDQSEACAAKFGWINERDQCLDLPKEATKNSQPYSVALPPLILSMFLHLRQIAVEDGTPDIDREFIFSTDGERRYTIPPGDREALLDLLPEEFEHFTLHDLRRSMATGLARIGVISKIVERGVLHHLPAGTSELERVYDRHEYLPESVVAVARWVETVEARLAYRENDRRICSIIDKEVADVENWAKNHPEEYDDIVMRNRPLTDSIGPKRTFSLAQFGRGHRGRKTRGKKTE